MLQKNFCSSTQTSTETKPGFRRAARVCLTLLLTLVLVVGLCPKWAFGAELFATTEPNTDWYDNFAGTDEDPYILYTAADLAGFAELVNNGNSFVNKTVELGNDINGGNTDFTPIGTEDCSFDGTFDGRGHVIDNFNIIAPKPDGTEDSSDIANVGYAGLFGHTDPESQLENVTLGNSVVLAIDIDDENGAYIDNVGALVGYSEGSIDNITSSAEVTLTSKVEQKSEEEPYTIKNIGGIAGVCYGSVTNCTVTSSAQLSVKQTSRPVVDSPLVHDVGGIVGFQGDISQLGKTSTYDSHGTIKNCSNEGNINSVDSFVVDTPSEAGIDRFGQEVAAESSEVGGIAGYARGSVIRCTNTAYLNMENAQVAGGIVGSLRSIKVEDDGSDEGTEEDPIECSECINEGIVYARVTVGGIVGQAGTYTTIRGCMNGTKYCEDNRSTAAFVLGTRWNKPYVGGIAGKTYGTVCYCGNLGFVASATWDSFKDRSIKKQTGYYSAGIVGGAYYYTESVGNVIEHASPDPLVYNCYNAGEIETQAGYRSRNIVGDNEGQAYDNVALEGMCHDDDMCVYGEIETESDAVGTAWNNVVSCFGKYSYDANGKLQLDDEGITQSAEDSLKGIGPMTYKFRIVDESGDADWDWGYGVKDSVFQHLNTQANTDSDWTTYWMASPDVEKGSEQINDGWPVLNWQVEGYDKINLAEEELILELLENASYDGTRAIPSISATLITYDEKTGDRIETVLLQNVDFRVIPDGHEGMGIEVTDDGEHPYEAYIEGIGKYTGSTELTCTVNYGINKGNLADCTAAVTSEKFNWTAQTPNTAEVKTSGGVVVDPSEYEIDLLDEAEQAIDAGTYDVVISAVKGSPHFEGDLESTWRITTVDLKSDIEWDNIVEIEYLEQTDYWYSTTNGIDDDYWNHVPSYAYTGHPIEPDIVAGSITYENHALIEGRDYQVIYGDLLYSDGDDDESEEDGDDDSGIKVDPKNTGSEGDIAYGAIMVRYVPGGNFHSYENMAFIIDGNATMEKIDINSKNVIVNAPDVPYENMPMCPVTVSYAGQELTEGVDYEITYTNNNAIGTASYVITGIGLFEGTRSGTFVITNGIVFEFTGELVEIDDITGVAITGVIYHGIQETFDLVIPGTFVIDGVEYPVIAIADSAFGGPSTASYAGTDKLKITTVTIPASVISIGAYAFGTGQGSTQSDPTITAVTFEEGSQLKYIGEYAFACCPITEFVFPAGVEVIGDYAFYKCTSLFTLVFDTTDADLPSSIGGSSFLRVGTSDREVRVLGYTSASAVIALAENNAAYGLGTINANGGVHFTFIERIADISSAEITAIPDQAWTGSAITPAIEVYLNGVLLDASCYTVSYTNNVDIGIAQVTATGAGGYFGSCSISFNIIASHVMTVYAGVDRYETATKIAASVAESGPYEGVIVCSGVNGKFADALCASGLSGVLGYPIMLVDGSVDTLDSAARSSISALLGGVRGNVVILGGTATVSTGIESALTQYAINAAPVRVSGADRYATAQEVYAYGANNGGWSTDYAIVAIGNNFPDALGAASFCTTNAAPMLLTDQNSETLESYVVSAASAANETIIVGGTTSVPNAKASALGNPQRMDGADRYETNLKFANWQLSHGMSLEGVGVATGTSFPDSLGSSSLLALTHSVLLLSSPSNNESLYTLLSDHKNSIENVSILGGENSVPEDVKATIRNTIGGKWVIDAR